MSNELKIFENAEFGRVRTALYNNQAWFVGVDCAVALKYVNTKQALLRHVDEEDRKVLQSVDFIERSRNDTFEIPPRGMTFINESGLFSLILRSDMPEAKKFKRWVTSEIIPAVLHNGGYIAGQENLTDAELMAKALLVAQNTIAEREKRIAAMTRTIEDQTNLIAEMKPKATYYDSILHCKDTMCARLIAMDYGISANKLNKILHEQHIQYHANRGWVLYIKYAGEGYAYQNGFQYYDTKGEPHIAPSLQWTQKGRLFIYDIMKKLGYTPVMDRA